MFTPFLSVQEKNGMKERLKVEHLSVSFFTDEGEVQAVRDVSFSLNAGEGKENARRIETSSVSV